MFAHNTRGSSQVAQVRSRPSLVEQPQRQDQEHEDHEEVRGLVADVSLWLRDQVPDPDPDVDALQSFEPDGSDKPPEHRTYRPAILDEDARQEVRRGEIHVWPGLHQGHPQTAVVDLPDDDGQRDAGQDGAHRHAHVRVGEPPCPQLLALQPIDAQHHQQQDVRTLEMTRADPLPHRNLLGYRDVRDLYPLLDQNGSGQQNCWCEVRPLP